MQMRTTSIWQMELRKVLEQLSRCLLDSRKMAWWSRFHSILFIRHFLLLMEALWWSITSMKAKTGALTPTKSNQESKTLKTSALICVPSSSSTLAIQPAMSSKDLISRPLLRFATKTKLSFVQTKYTNQTYTKMSHSSASEKCLQKWATPIKIASSWFRCTQFPKDSRANVVSEADISRHITWMLLQVICFTNLSPLNCAPTQLARLQLSLWWIHQK